MFVSLHRYLVVDTLMDFQRLIHPHLLHAGYAGLFHNVVAHKVEVFKTIEGDHFTMEDILIRPDVVFENCLTKAREGNPYYQDNLISLLAENEGFKRFLQPSDEQWMHQRMLEQEKETEERKANPDDLPF